jgi:hypothetical protein
MDATADNSLPSAIYYDINVKSRAPPPNHTAQDAVPNSHAPPREMATWRMTSAPNNGKDRTRSRRIDPPDFARALHHAASVTGLRLTALHCAAWSTLRIACGRAAQIPFSGRITVRQLTCFCMYFVSTSEQSMS